MTLAAGKRTLKCRNDSLLQHFCTCRLEGGTLLHPDLTARRVWWVSPSPTLPASGVNQSNAVFRFLIALVRGAAPATCAPRRWLCQLLSRGRVRVRACSAVSSADIWRRRAVFHDYWRHFYHSVFSVSWIQASLSWFQQVRTSCCPCWC